MVTEEGVDVLLHLFLTSALDEGELPALCSGSFIYSDRVLLPIEEGLGGPRASLDVFEKRNDLPVIEPLFGRLSHVSILTSLCSLREMKTFLSLGLMGSHIDAGIIRSSREVSVLFFRL